MRVPLFYVAHSRTGDKGNSQTLSLIPYDMADYPVLAQAVTPARVKAHFGALVEGAVTRYDLPLLAAFNFVLVDALQGGVNDSLALDTHGKSRSAVMLALEIDLPDDHPRRAAMRRGHEQAEESAIMRLRLLAVALAAAFGATAARAEIPGNKITIGVLTDMNAGNADATGKGSVVAAQLAAEDAAAFLPGVTIEVIGADHQNNPDTASTISRGWIANRGVNVIADVPFSSAGLAVSEAARGAPRTLFVASGSGTSDMTGKACSPNTVQWTYDTYATGNVVARALVGQGDKSWFFVTADYAFGASLERDTSQTVKALGGTIVGDVKNPPFAPDFSSYLLTAQSSGAQVIGIANASIDMINIVKQAHEFGIGRDGKQRLAALLTLITDVESLGLETAQGLYLASPFYWDYDARTRAFSARFAAKMNGRKPTMLQAGVYSGVLHYLKAVKDVNDTAAPAVMVAMQRLPADDDAFGKGAVRRDGRAIHDFHLFQVKKPSESSGKWDDYRLISTVPAADVFRPMAEGGCPLVK